MSSDEKELGNYDAVVVATPSAQAATLLSGISPIADLCDKIKMNGCWALMLAFEDSLQLEFDAAFVHNSPLSWIARNNSKPRRTERGETWVVHATPHWTEAHIETPDHDVSRELFDEFWQAVGKSKVKPSHTSLHRWRYAIPKASVSQVRNNSATVDGSLEDLSQVMTHRCLFDEQQWLGACGDWCTGGRVEGAFLSGMAMAGRILGRLNGTAAPTSEAPKQLALF